MDVALQAQLLSKRVEALEEYQGLTGPASTASVRNLPDELTALKEQNAALQIVSIVAIVLALVSLLLSVTVIILIMCRNQRTTGNPCPTPATQHVQMKEVQSGVYNGDTCEWRPKASTTHVS